MVMTPTDLDILLSAVPTELGWGLILALLVRGLVAAIPRIVDSVTRAMTERATAQRLAEQVRLTEAETDKAEADERRGLTGKLAALETRIEEQERACGVEIESAHALHRQTRDRLDHVEALHLKCERSLKSVQAELQELRASIKAMR